MPQLNVRLGRDLADKLEALRRERGISISHLARLALEEKANELLAGGCIPPNPPRGRAAVLARRLAAQEGPKAQPEAHQEVLENLPDPVEDPDPTPTPRPSLLVAFTDDCGDLWLPVDLVAERLGVQTTELISQLEADDFRTFGGETCITSFGIQTAIALARSEDLDTTEFELELERVSQAT